MTGSRSLRRRVNLAKAAIPPRSLEKQSPPRPTDPVALVTDVSTRSGIVTPSNTTPMVGAIVHPATKGGAEGRDAGPRAIRGRRQSGNRAG